MFLENVWYVAAWDRDVGRAPLARIILNRPIVFYRTEDGTPVALEDRCVHRNLPLSKGTLIGDQIQCGYHGLCFDASGTCVDVPAQSTIPPGAEVRSYPVVERNRWIWIWMGDPALADDTKITDFHWIEAPGWGADGDYIHLECNYQLMVDNLLDQTHIAYVHPTTLGDAGVVEDLVMEVDRTEDDLTIMRWILDKPGSPLYQNVYGLTGNLDRWMIVNYSAPGFVRFNTGGAAKVDDRDSMRDMYCPLPEGGIQTRNLNALTPETETSTHYFWGQAQSFKPEDAAYTAKVCEQIGIAFAEDKVILEAQQRSIGQYPGAPTIDINTDGPHIYARKIMDRLLREERASTPGLAAE